MSNGDRTLMQDSLTGKALTEEQARHLAETFQNNINAIIRFEALEADLTEIVGVVNKIKKAVVWIIGLLMANYIGTFWGSIESLL